MKYGVMFCSFSGNTGYQIYFPNSADPHVYERGYYSNDFQAWKAVTVGTPTYLSSYATLSDLASALGEQETNWFGTGKFVRYLYKYKAVSGNPLKLNGSGACLVVIHHVISFVCAYIIYQTDTTSYANIGYHKIFQGPSISELNMYMDSTNNCFYFKGTGGSSSIGMIPLCGDLSLQQVSADLSQMTKIF